MSRFRESISRTEALPQLSALAIVIGVVVGLLIVVFRIALDSPALALDISSAERFEELSALARVGLILSGTALIGLIFHLLKNSQRPMGVAHVIDRLHNHQGRLPMVNAAAQLVLCVVAICSGHSVGREGPAVHAGAGVTSRLVAWLRLPNNSMATMIACGVAAGISASFDTPLAGVIFAMEVILMEYTIVGFVPVILSSVIAAAISKSALGDAMVFEISSIEQIGLRELGIVAASGMLIGTLAFIYIRLNTWTLSVSSYSLSLRLLVAGATTATAAAFVPEIMGLGYDTVQGLFDGQLALSAVILIAMVKLVITPTSVGLGIPGGLIGPSLFIGASVGFVCATLADQIFPGLNVDTQTYILLGMAGMFSASINAPLAGLVAILELSRNPNIIFPAMLLICVACITARYVFGVKGVFIEQLQQRGQTLMCGAAENALKKISVLSEMNKRFVESPEHLSISEAADALQDKPDWIVYRDQDDIIALKARDLAQFIDANGEYMGGENASERGVDNSKGNSSENQTLNIILGEIPAQRFYLQPIKESDSVFDAWLALEKSQRQHLYVTSHYREHNNILGVLSGERVRECYQPKSIHAN